MPEKDKTKGFIADVVAAAKKHFSTEQKFAEAQAKDGSTVVYEGDTPAAGMAIMVKTPDGATAPAPDGIIEMADGSMITVMAGKIAEVKMPGVPEPCPEPPMDMNKNGMNPDQVKKLVESTIKEHYYSKEDVDSKLTDLENKNTALEQAFGSVKSENETLTKELATTKAELETMKSAFAKHEAFAKDIANLLETPQVKPETPKKQFNTQNEAAKLSREEWQKKYGIN